MSAEVERLVGLAMSARSELAAGKWVAALFKRKPASVMQAVGLLVDGSVTERYVGAWLMAELGYPQKPFLNKRINLLAKLCHDEAEKVRIRAILSLGCLKEPRADELVRKYYKDKSPKIRLAVAQSISLKGSSSAVKVLCDLARDQDASVRDWTAFSLGQQSKTSRSIINGLMWLTRDEVARVREEAVCGLIRHKEFAAVHCLARELRSLGIVPSDFAPIHATLRKILKRKRVSESLMDCIDELVWFFEGLIEHSGPSNEQSYKPGSDQF